MYNYIIIMMRNFDHSLPMLLLRARETTMAHFRPTLKEHGLTEQQWRVLRVLWEENGLEVMDLAAQTIILQPSLTGVINRLERDGLLERRKDKVDGRKVCIWMTRKAKRLYERIIPLVERKYAEMQAKFSKGKWQELYESLFYLVEVNGNKNN